MATISLSPKYCCKKNYLSEEQVDELIQRLPQSAAEDNPASEAVSPCADADKSGNLADSAKIFAGHDAKAVADSDERCPPTLKDPGSLLSSLEQAPKVIEGNKVTAGSVWRDFEIIEKIGTGGMAEVYKAMQKAPKRIVALKMLTSKDISEQSLARFLKEAQLSARLTHPHIVKMYQAEIYNRTPFIAMAYIEGWPLDQYFREKKPEIYEVLTILEAIARALHYAHEENIIHRDIKPGNIMIGNDCTPYLMDFGIARATVADFSLTRSGQLLGTPQYMAPEQADGENKTLDRRADIYSLGVIMYELVTGHPAVEGNTVVEILFNLTTRAVIPPRNWKPNLPEALEFIILKAMAYEKEQRYSTAHEFADAIETFLAGENLKPKKNLEYFRLKFRYHYQLHRNQAITLLIIVLAVTLCLALWRPSPGPRKLTIQAAACFSAKEYDKALDLLEKALKLQIGHRQALGLKAKIAEKLSSLATACFSAKKYDKALDLLEKSLRAKSDQRQALILKAKICARLNHGEQMRSTWAQLFKFFQNDAECLEFLAKQALHYQYCEEAVDYFSALLLWQPQLSTRAQLAIALVKIGGNSRAAKLLDQSGENTDTVWLAKAMLRYHQCDLDMAQKILAKIVGKGMDNNLLAELYFLRAKLQWQRSQKQLTQWQWLLPNIYEAQQNTQIREKLEAIAADLSKAAQANPDYPEIAHYRTALQIECMPFSAVSDSSQEKFAALVGSLPVSFRESLLFKKITVRYLIRHVQWQKAAVLCSQLIDHYPWESDFYYFRAIAHLSCGNKEKTMDDIKQAAALDQYNFIPVETFMLLALRNFTQREYYLFYRIINIYFLNPIYPIDKLLFTAPLKKLRSQFFEAKKQVAGIGKKDQPPIKLIEKALQIQSEQGRKVGIAMIAACEDEEQLTKDFATLQASYKNKKDHVKTKKLAEINSRVNEYKELQIKRTLLRYAVAEDDRYSLKLRRNSRATNYLKKIFADTTQAPMMRFLAARMLVALRDFETFKWLLDIVQGKKYPENLLAAVAIRQAQIIVSMPELENFSEKKVFYRALYAWHFVPHNKKQQQLAEKLLHDPQEIVALYAAYNMRRYKDLPKKLQKEAVRTFRDRLFISVDPQIRAVACRTFWTYNHMGYGLSSPFEDKKFQAKASVAAFNDHYRELLTFLQDNSFEVRLAALISTLGESMLKRQEVVKRIKPQVVEAIQNALQSLRKRENSYLMKFWTMAAMGIWNRGKNFLDVVGNSSLPFSVRIGAILGVYHSRSLSSIGGLLAFIKLPSRTAGDKALKQALVVMLAHLTKHTFNNANSFVLTQILTWLRHPDIEIRKAALASLLWCGNYRNLAMLHTYLQPETGDDMQCAAMTSYCALLARHRPPRLIEQFNRQIMHYRLPLREAAAFGYYHSILSENYIPKSYGARQWYDRYCQKIKENCQPEWLPLLAYAAEIAPNWRYFYESAIIHYRLQQFPLAKQQLQKALLCLKEESGDLDNWAKVRCLILAARMLNHAKKYQESIAKLNLAAKQMPFSAKVYFYWAENLDCIGQKDEALEKYAQSYLCDPEDVDPLYRMASIYLSQKNIEAAIAMLKFSYGKFPKPRHELLAYPQFAILKNHPWIKSLSY